MNHWVQGRIIFCKKKKKDLIGRYFFKKLTSYPLKHEMVISFLQKRKFYISITDEPLHLIPSQPSPQGSPPLDFQPFNLEGEFKFVYITLRAETTKSNEQILVCQRNLYNCGKQWNKQGVWWKFSYEKFRFGSLSFPQTKMWRKFQYLQQNTHKIAYECPLPLEIFQRESMKIKISLEVKTFYLHSIRC